jgi:hypothetical protein
MMMALNLEMCRGSLLTTVIDDTNPQIQLSPSAGDWGLNNNTVFINSTLQYVQSFVCLCIQLTFDLTVSRRIQMHRSH